MKLLTPDAGNNASFANDSDNALDTVRIDGMNVEDRKQACRRIVEADLTRGDAFFLTDLGDVFRKHQTWKAVLPTIEPFYAIKCNSDPVILKALASLKIGFDCASAGEIQTMLDLGVSPNQIIYANPCKPVSHIHFARKVGVKLMTFDNENELLKCAKHYPTADLILRVLADDSKAACRLGLKFGARPGITLRLLQRAKTLGLNIVGVSFHVGSGSTDASAFGDAVHRARRVFDQGRQLGFNMAILDVGGGFPGAPFTAAISFTDIAASLTAAIDECFPPESGVRIIAEPGRFYVASASCLAVNITSKRASHEVNDDSTDDDDLISIDDNASLSAALPDTSTLPESRPRSSFSSSSSSSSSNSNSTSNLGCMEDAQAHAQAQGSDAAAVLTARMEGEVDCATSTELGDACTAATEQSFMYYVNDGVYGSFNCILFDHAEVCGEVLTAACLDASAEDAPTFTSSIWGPTCDSMDCIQRDAALPELEVGDWLFYNDMGAYTSCAASTFNGFQRSLHFYTFSADLSFDVAEQLPATFPVRPHMACTMCFDLDCTCASLPATMLRALDLGNGGALSVLDADAQCGSADNTGISVPASSSAPSPFALDASDQACSSVGIPACMKCGQDLAQEHASAAWNRCCWECETQAQDMPA